MIDTATKKPLQVSVGMDARPYLRISLEQLKNVQELLDEHQIHYWVDLLAISLDGGPEITVINFYYDTDPTLVQRLLDNLV